VWIGIIVLALDTGLETKVGRLWEGEALLRA